MLQESSEPHQNNYHIYSALQSIRRIYQSQRYKYLWNHWISGKYSPKSSNFRIKLFNFRLCSHETAYSNETPSDHFDETSNPTRNSHRALEKTARPPRKSTVAPAETVQITLAGSGARPGHKSPGPYKTRALNRV